MSKPTVETMCSEASDFLNQTSLELQDACRSVPFLTALRNDMKTLPVAQHDYAMDDVYFQKMSEKTFPIFQQERFGEFIETWEAILGSFAEHLPEHFKEIHKGTPYYFLSCAEYLVHDYDRAVLYMDSAVAEDVQNFPQWQNMPAGLFFRLQAAEPNQAARHIVDKIRREFQDWISASNDPIQHALDVDTLVKKISTAAISTARELRSAMTALYSFLLQYQQLHRFLRICSGHPASNEHVYLHLLKGAVIWETLLKQSDNSLRKAKLSDVFKRPEIKTKVGLPISFQAWSNMTFKGVVQKAKEKASAGPAYRELAFGVASGLRNTTAHSLAWDHTVEPDEYRTLFQLMLDAILKTISAFY